MKKNNKKGFTLAELLIVVAILAVLIAIAIPIFSAQLEKAKESTDAANIRAAYAEVAVLALDDPDTAHSKGGKFVQSDENWQNTFTFPSNLTSSAASTKPTNGGDWTVTWDKANNRFNFNFALKPVS